MRQDNARARPLATSGSPSRVDLMLEALLALGVILASTSQLRVDGVPLGPGEACLFGWATLRGSRALLFRRPLGNGAGGAVLLFWVIFAIAQSIGLLRALSMSVPIDWSLTLHDATAYVLIALISSFCLSGEDAGASLSRVTKHVMTFATISLCLQIASGLGLVPVIGTGPWYWDRFRGWADNPNQLSLACAMITAMAVFRIETAERRNDRLMAIACALAAFTAGIMTQGNTMRLSLAIATCCFVAVRFGSLVLSRRPGASLTALGFVLLIGAIPLIGLSMLPYMSSITTKDLAQHVSRDQGETLNEADLRFTLWSGALKNGLDSLYLGLGPGPHAPVPIDVTLRRVWDADSAEESLGLIARHADFMESHNTYIELFSQGGLLIMLAYGWLLLRAARHAFRSGSAALPAVFCVFIVFGMFHVVVRHPVVWLALCLCLGGDVDRPQPRIRRVVQVRTPAAGFAHGP